MKVCTCFLLIRIIAFTNSIPRTKLQPASESVPENNDDENSEENKNLDNDILKAAGTDGDENLKLIFKTPKVESLTDFIQETVDILNIYEDTAFKDFFLILDKEIRNYHYRGCKFSELTENRDTRSLLQRTLKIVRGKPVTYMKASVNELADMLRDETYDKNVKELLDYINSLYKNSKRKFNRFLNNLNHYRKAESMTNDDLVQVVRDGVRTILFNHYTELDTYTKRELNERIKIFWEKIKNSPALNENDTDPVGESAKKSFDVFKNVMNEVKEPEFHFKEDLKTNLKNIRDIIFSKETHYEQSEDKEIEEHVTSNEFKEHVTSNEFEEQATDNTAEGLSSRQSFDSSSNSIKLSQERHIEYNTQRYMTLYTEEISYKARTMKETEINPSEKLPLTTTPRYSPRHVTDRMKEIEILRTNMDGKQRDISPDIRHDAEGVLIQELKIEPRAKPHYNHEREHIKPGKTISKSRHKNAQLYSQYDAVVDVQLANTDLLESLRMFAPVGIGSRESGKYNTSLYPRAAAQKRAQTAINLQNATARAKSPVSYSISYESHYRKPVNESRRSISPFSPNNRSAEQYVKDTKPKQKSPTRRIDSDTQVFNDYIIKRINTLENELKDLKQIHDVRSKIQKNNTDEVQLSNVTNQRKDMNRNNIERLLNRKNTNSDKNEVIKQNTNENNTKINATNSESITNNNTSSKPNEMNNETANATIIENTTTSQVTNINITIYTKTDNEELNKEETTKTVTSTDSTVEVTTAASTTVAGDDSPPTTDVARRTKAYAPADYYDYPDRGFDPFDHMGDGLDLNM